jgi:hypothetical protein
MENGRTANKCSQFGGAGFHHSVRLLRTEPLTDVLLATDLDKADDGRACHEVFQNRAYIHLTLTQHIRSA